MHLLYAVQPSTTTRLANNMSISQFAPRRWFLGLTCAATLLLLGTTVQASPLTAQDEKQILSVVKNQLAAFAADDADKAFSYAAPNIRQMVVTANAFMSMVRSQYAVVYRPSSVIFLKPQGAGNEALLNALLSDSNGREWTASYTLQRQKNRTWRIAGCQLGEAAGGRV